MCIYIYMDIDFDIDIDHIDDLRLKSYKITSNPTNCLSDFFRFLWAQGIEICAEALPDRAGTLASGTCGMDMDGFWDWIISLPALFQRSAAFGFSLW